MSKSTDPTATTILDSISESTDIDEKRSLVTRTKTFVKNHKKAAIAVAGLSALVALSAVVGRTADPSTDTDLSDRNFDDEVAEESETDTVA